MRYQLKRIDPMSVLRIGVAVGVVVGVVTSLLMSPLVAATRRGDLGLLEVLFVLVNVPVRGIVAGLFAALGAVVYNWLVRWTGGIEVELEPREHQLQPGGPTPLAPPSQTPEQ